jgi:cytochrome c
MQTNKILTIALFFLNMLWSGFAIGQQTATPQDVVAKVRDAASTLSKASDLAQFNQKEGPWVWNGTYIFVQNCDKKTIAAHPIKAELIGQDFMAMKDTKGHPLFQKDYCEAARKPSGVWSEYWWPKPGETEGSRKLTYSLAAKGTPYVVVGSLYDDKASVSEVSKLTSKK